MALFVLVIAGTAHAQFVHVSNCRIITQRGSYVVINNINATASNAVPIPGGGSACILITTDFVTLNLAGFAITGSNVSSGIATDSVDRSGIHVHSGTVANFSDIGVNLHGNGHTIEQIRAVNNLGGGISVFGSITAKQGHRVLGNTAISNGDFGINVACPAVVLGNVAAGNGAGSAPEQIVVGFTACTRQENSPSP